ncbi:hypothetical protein B0H15DRAFT_823519 [Mycena belliarum]|uniref:C3H1-type domain-containing protein n=1 Tax=Mycena belliarum TaxID=1033014 RepID=A0AAD6XWI8_9AGAR|nr:hypothetical protein B0H15DRAFT_823519 [Mycena belliae]
MSGVTKKYRCRYFEEDGRPIHPTCNQGDSCRFVHPNDSNWPGLKPFVDTRLLKSSSASKRNKEGRRVAGSSEGRGPALVSQSDLFLRCKVEVDDPRTDPQAGRLPQKEHDRDRDRDRIRAHDARDAGGYKSYSKNRSVSPARPNVKKYARTGSDSSRRSDFATNKNKNKQDSDPVDNDSGRRSEAANANIIPNAKGSANPRPDFPSSITQTAKWIGPAKMQATASLEATAPLQVTDEGKCAERLVDLFRRLARLSNQVMQETAAHEKEGKKLQTYTEISSALSKISSSAATSVAPTLADIMLKHEQSKHRAEESLKALGGAWEQVFDVFVTEIAHVIDARLQDAMTKLKTEGESTIIEIMANAPGPRTTNGSASYDRKRARTRGPAEKENEESRSGRGASRDRDHKRRRLASRSSSPASHERSGRPNDDTSIEEILTQMKHKIDQQARSLQQLTKENSEVKI